METWIWKHFDDHVMLTLFICSLLTQRLHAFTTYITMVTSNSWQHAANVDALGDIHTVEENMYQQTPRHQYIQIYILVYKRTYKHQCNGTQSSLQWTVESDYTIAIATLSDWFKNLQPVFQPIRSKTNLSIRAVFELLSKVIRDCDCCT